MLLEPGKIVTGTVTGISPFGAFVSLGEGKTGLVHISEVALSYVKNISDFLKEKDEVRVKIISIDDKGKVSLSIKQALLEEKKKNSASAAPAARVPKTERVDFSKKSNGEPLTFEDMMSKFKQASDEKMQDLKRGMESKRGTSYRRSSSSF
ncbi:MAG: S1 RNA-binding domain-containing protein [Ruminococcaceae bacterium]|nr:S1 RNA-binding domain-containing protein [Oscillospiraceae bacterium]